MVLFTSSRYFAIMCISSEHMKASDKVTEYEKKMASVTDENGNVRATIGYDSQASHLFKKNGNDWTSLCGKTISNYRLNIYRYRLPCARCEAKAKKQVFQ